MKVLEMISRIKLTVLTRSACKYGRIISGFLDSVMCLDAVKKYWMYKITLTDSAREDIPCTRIRGLASETVKEGATSPETGMKHHCAKGSFNSFFLINFILLISFEVSKKICSCYRNRRELHTSGENGIPSTSPEISQLNEKNIDIKILIIPMKIIITRLINKIQASRSV